MRAPVEPTHAAAPTALVFPGQGAQTAEMLAELAGLPGFAARYAVVHAAAPHRLPATPGRLDETALCDNATGSLLAVLGSALWLDAWRARGEREDFHAGYSVGQWTALYAAGALAFPQLVAVVAKRAELMDAAQASGPGAMLAVIGLGEGALRAWLTRFNAAGHDLVITNFNSLGQYSLGGSVAAVTRAVAELGAEPGVRKVVRLPVSGAWHCARLAAAAAPFGEFLARIELARVAHPVIDNVTGEPLPEHPDALRAQLVRHLTEPVRWSDGIRWLAARGVRRFVEIGHGDLLTKFGTFIARDGEHVAIAPNGRTR